MLKENRNKGFFSGIFLSILLLAMAGLTFFLWNSMTNPSASFAGKASSGTAVKMKIYDIYPEPIGEIEGGNVIYLVQYDKNGQGKFAGIEAAPNHSKIKEIIEQAKGGKLVDQPATLVGTQLAPLNTTTNTSRNDRIINYGSFIRSVLDPTSQVYRNMNTNYYLSLSENEKDAFWFLLGTVGLLVTAIVTFVASFLLRRRTIASFEELHHQYPELQGDLSKMADEASFYDQNLKVILYKNHLISYFKGTQAIDLRDVQQIYIQQTNIRQSGFARSIYTIQYIRKDRPKKLTLPIKQMKKDTPDRLQKLFDQIAEKFPDIHLGI